MLRLCRILILALRSPTLFSSRLFGSVPFSKIIFLHSPLSPTPFFSARISAVTPDDEDLSDFHASLQDTSTALLSRLKVLILR